MDRVNFFCAECVTVLDLWSKAHIFESFLTTFEVCVIFWGSWGSSINQLESETESPQPSFIKLNLFKSQIHSVWFWWNRTVWKFWLLELQTKEANVHRYNVFSLTKNPKFQVNSLPIYLFNLTKESRFLRSSFGPRVNFWKLNLLEIVISGPR